MVNYFEQLLEAQSPQDAALKLRAASAQFAVALWEDMSDSQRRDVLSQAARQADALERAGPGDPWREWLSEWGHGDPATRLSLDGVLVAHALRPEEPHLIQAFAVLRERLRQYIEAESLDPELEQALAAIDGTLPDNMTVGDRLGPCHSENHQGDPHRVLDEENARFFTCAECERRFCTECEGEAGSDLCDECAGAPA